YETKYSTALCGKNSRNSLQSCAASVLLCAITRAGRPTFSIVHAIVAVLPVPVAPISVWKRSPASSPSLRISIAFGWSPVGRYSEDVFSGGTGDTGYPGMATATRPPHAAYAAIMGT